MLTILTIIIACEVKTPEQHAADRYEHYRQDLSHRLIKYKPEEGVTCYFLPSDDRSTRSPSLSCFPEPRVVLLPPGPTTKAR